MVSALFGVVGQQAPQWYSETVGEFLGSRQCRVPCTAFDARDVGPVDSCCKAEGLLRETILLAQPPNVSAELRSNIHCREEHTDAADRSTDDESQFLLDLLPAPSNHLLMDAAVAPSHHVSSSLEKVLEHRLLAAITTELWVRGVRDFEVLRGEVDAHGYDLVLEVSGILRHIQLKAMIRGGKRRDVGVSLALGRKPSGCVIWMTYDPDTLELGPFLWFGNDPGAALPALGDRSVRHSKGDAQGFKAERTGHRLVSRSRFSQLPDVGDLVDALFGKTQAARTIE